MARITSSELEEIRPRASRQPKLIHASQTRVRRRIEGHQVVAETLDRNGNVVGPATYYLLPPEHFSTLSLEEPEPEKA